MSAQSYLGLVYACHKGHLDVVDVLLKMEDEKYFLSEMNDADLIRAVWYAIDKHSMEIVKCPLAMENMMHVLPKMEGFNISRALSAAIKGIKWSL